MSNGDSGLWGIRKDGAGQGWGSAQHYKAAFPFLEDLAIALGRVFKACYRRKGRIFSIS